MAEVTVQPEVSALGKQLSEHAGQGLGGKISWIFSGIIGAIMVVGGVGWGISLILDQLRSSRASIGLMILMIVVALVIVFTGFAIAALSFRNVYRSIGLKVALHEHGILHTWRTQQTVIPWDTIENVWFQPYSLGNSRSQANFVSYRLTHANGQVVTIDQAQIPDAGHIGRSLMQITEKRLLPLSIAQIEGGQSVTFGIYDMQIKADQAGLHYKDKTLLWAEAAGIVTDEKNGELRIMQRGAPGQKDKVWNKFFLPQVSNPGVLSGLIKHMSSKQVA